MLFFFLSFFLSFFLLLSCRWPFVVGFAVTGVIFTSIALSVTEDDIKKSSTYTLFTLFLKPKKQNKNFFFPTNFPPSSSFLFCRIQKSLKLSRKFFKTLPNDSINSKHTLTSDQYIEKVFFKLLLLVAFSSTQQINGSWLS